MLNELGVFLRELFKGGLRKDLFEHPDFDKAKAYIDSIRSKCPTALNARESAIILLDSINIALSKVELQKMEEEMSKIVNPDKIAKDTLDFYHDEAKEKVRFFERKLQHDIQHKAVH